MLSLFSSLPRRVRLSLLVLSIASGVPLISRAAEEPAPKKELSEAAGEELSKLRPLLDAKNYDEGLQRVDAALAKAPANSYDRAILSQMKAQIFFFKNDYTNAIEPLETALQLGDKYNYFDTKTRLELVNYLSQLYAQEANTPKIQPEKQRAAYAKAYSYIRRWLDESNKPDADKELFAAFILYSQAQQNPEKIDLNLIKQAEAELRKGMLMVVKPKDQFYIMLLATLQQEGDFARSAELLELLVKQFPNNKNYWQQLAATYLTLQQDVRAIVTIERAQKLGQMNTPKDNFTLVGIHMNIQQYDRAIDLLEAGLHNGSIDNEEKNWEYLAQCYQLVRKEAKAIEVLKEASKIYPKAGNLDMLIGQYYYSLDKPEEAYKYLDTSFKKGIEGKSPTQLAQGYVFLAYLGFEIKKLDEALKAANKALELDPNSKDAKRLRDSIMDSIKEREAAKNPKSA